MRKSTFKTGSRLLLLLTLALSVVVTGCQAATKNNNGVNQATVSPSATTSTETDAATNEPVKDGTLIVALSTDVTLLDPTRQGGWQTFLVNRNIHESLVKEDLSKTSEEAAVVEIIPSLAETWEVSPDGLTYTFHLRKGVKFQDGTDFNADAVEFNVRRAWDKEFEFFDEVSATNMSRIYNDLKSIQAVDANTFSFTFNHPFQAFLRLLAQGSTGSGLIASPTAIRELGNDKYAEHPVGTGPFVFVERVIGDHVTVKRNDNYWGDKAYAQQLIFRLIADNNARATALRTGEVDIILSPAGETISSLKQDGFSVPAANLPSVFYLTLNTQNEYFKDIKVRQAFAYAIDRESLSKDLLEGNATPAYSAAHTGNEAYDADHKPFPYDPEKAKQLLAEAGYPDGFGVTIQTYTGNEAYVEWVQRDLAKVGIQLKIETFDWATFGAQRFMKPEVGVNTMSWGFVTAYWIYVLGHSESTGRYGGYTNPAIDEVIAKANNEIDPDKALAYWKEARDIIDNDVAIVPLFSSNTSLAQGRNVKGLIVPSQNWFDLTKVWTEK